MKRKIRRLKRMFRKIVPFKGKYAYESQIGPLVIQYFHVKGFNYRITRGIGDLRFWFDKMWIEDAKELFR